MKQKNKLFLLKKIINSKKYLLVSTIVQVMHQISETFILDNRK